MRLLDSFFQRPTIHVAKSLLGKCLVRKTDSGVLSGLIVEVEAYLWRDDEACHATHRKKAGNAMMFERPGMLYVYPIHAKCCMNLVTEKEGRGASVLIRALQPLIGLQEMAANRGIAGFSETPREICSLTSGPGKLCQALAVDRGFNGRSIIDDSDIWIENTPFKKNISRSEIRSSSRIGISRGKDLQLRFFIDGNRFVSGRATDHSIPSISRIDFLAGPSIGVEKPIQ